MNTNTLAPLGTLFYGNDKISAATQAYGTHKYGRPDLAAAEAIAAGLVPKPIPKTLADTFTPLETDPSGGSLNAPGKKGDANKIQAWLCLSGFSRALREVAKVTTLGAQKYTPNGWATVPNGSERYMEAFGRHLLDLGEGKVFDDGPGGLGSDVYHKASLVWNLLASLELELRAKKWHR